MADNQTTGPLVGLASREAFLTKRVEECGADMEHMLEVMGAALDALEDDNDAASAEAYLRTCLRKFNRR